MKVLIVYGSRNGSTRKMAEEISSVLTKDGLEVHIADADDEIEHVAEYDLVVVGSAIYKGSWLKAPKRFVRQNQEALRAMPVWLFSSGLRSEDPRSRCPKVISEFHGSIGQRDHRFFSGSLDPMEIGWLHRMMLRLPGIRSMFPVGDFRDWEAIRAYAEEIAASFGAEQGRKPADARFQDEVLSGPLLGRNQAASG